MFKIFKKKKTEPTTFMSVAEALTRFGEAIQKSNKAFKIFILYTDKTKFEQQEIDKIKNQLNYMYSVLINDTPCIFSYVTQDMKISVKEMFESDIIINTGYYEENNSSVGRAIE